MAKKSERQISTQADKKISTLLNASTRSKPQEEASEAEADVMGVGKPQDAVIDANQASPPDSALSRKRNEKESVSWASSSPSETSQKK
jgi:hypothetical protein